MQDTRLARPRDGVLDQRGDVRCWVAPVCSAGVGDLDDVHAARAGIRTAGPSTTVLFDEGSPWLVGGAELYPHVVGDAGSEADDHADFQLFDDCLVDRPAGVGEHVEFVLNVDGLAAAGEDQVA